MINAQSPWPASRPRDVQLSELRPYSGNARTHSKAQIKQIANSIEEWGWTSPLLITSDGMIIAGHGRYLAAKQLKLDRVPTVVATSWNAEQIRAYVIADNKLALNAGWDEELLASELADLQGAGFAVDLIGFTNAELAELIPAADKFLTDVDDVPSNDITPICKPGDCWQLGEHRLICGDATDPVAYEKLLGDEQPHCCWTDPPYNVNYQSRAGAIANDNLADHVFADFLQTAFDQLARVLAPGSPIYVAHADTEGLNFRSAFNRAGFKLSGVLIWEKNSLVLGRSDYQWKHEPILYGWKPGAAHSWYGDRKQTTVAELNGNVFCQNEDGSVVVRVGNETMIIEGDNLNARAIEPSIIRVDKPSASAEHPTMKPVELINSMLKNSTAPGHIVLDPFGGSGSTLVACEALGRRARIIELDPRYCDVIIERWQNLTGRCAARCEIAL